MATCFDRWEKDPFFPAAEEVQESCDRMESVYRRWVREKKDAAMNSDGGDGLESGELLRELQTVLGTAKWQLDELNRAVKSNDEAFSAGKETRTRHNQFVEAIGSQISMVESSIKESNLERGEGEHSWVRLDEGEREELALFLACPLPPRDSQSRGGRRSNEMVKKDVNGERLSGHRRTASALPDIGAWTISVPNDSQPCPPPHKSPSFSCLLNDLESASKVKWSKNVFRKLKGGDQHIQGDFETIPLRNQELSVGCNACYERTKSCLSSCGHEVSDKQLYGWFGALQRQLQRSQYQIQYGRPVHFISLAILVVLLIALYALWTI